MAEVSVLQTDASVTKVEVDFSDLWFVPAGALAHDLSWTSLVPQLGEEFGDVGGDCGFGVELLTASDADGDVLQGA